MAAYKDAKRGTWFVKFRYKNRMNGTKNVMKRGFSTKREAHGNFAPDTRQH